MKRISRWLTVCFTAITVQVFSSAAHANLTALHSFTSNLGGGPESGVTFDASGNLYGTTFGGGTNHAGTLYEYSVTGQFTELYDFSSSSGTGPEQGRLVLDANGNIYGTAAFGGTLGGGTLFKYSSTGQYSVLYNFSDGKGDTPLAGVIFDANGNMYGTTAHGGAHGEGSIFEYSSTGQFTKLADFTASSGYESIADVAFDNQGNLYGTTFRGGVNGGGTLFELTGVTSPTIFPTPEPDRLSFAVVGITTLLAGCYQRRKPRSRT